MKRIFTIVAVFCVFSLSTKAEGAALSVDPGTPEDEECTKAAWDYGTRQGNGDHNQEYFMTNWYYEVYCAD